METKKITITVDPKASKQEEMDILIKLRKSFEGTGCYLEGLFSKALLEWATPRIRDDGTINIMETLAYTENLVIESEQKGAALLKDLEDTLREKEALIGQLNDQAMNAESKLHHAEAHLEQLDERFEATCKQLGEERQKALAQGNEIISLQREIINLKAKLYDMLVTAN